MADSKRSALIQAQSWSKSSALLAVATLAGCAAGPSHRAPVIDAPARFQGAASFEDSADLSTWWEALGDPTLVQLVNASLQGNLDIAQAQARLKTARASLAQSRAALAPSLSLSASAGATERDTGATSETYSDQIDARWTLDLFGAARRGAEAARANAQSATYSLASVRIAIAAETARTYVDLRTAQTRLAIGRETLRAQDDNLAIARYRERAGLVSGLDVDQARAQRAVTAATLPQIERTAASARFRLAVLAGKAPGGLDIDLAEGAIPSPPAADRIGLPANLLRRRPDVLVSERALAAATARIGVAQAQMLPSLTLSGSIASTATRLDSLNEDWVRSAVAGLTQPIFQAGALRAIVRQRRAEAEGALAAYRASVLDAFADVENALAARDSASARVAAFTEQAEAAESAAELARLNYRAGLIDFQRLLETERSLLSARDGLASAQGDTTLAAVQLYLALGGGWAVNTDATESAQK